MVEEKKKMVKISEIEDKDEIFEEIMKCVGQKGFFQKRFNLLFNFLYVVLISMPCMNTVLILTIPDHWCHVPGMNSTNLTLDQWKNITLPIKHGPESTYSHCEMYNLTDVSIGSDEMKMKNQVALHEPQIIDCQHGWDFDKTWYTRTIPSEYDWVCDKELRVANIFAVGRFADLIGTFVFGQLADMVGRRPVFFIALAILLVGRVLSAFVAENYMLFLACTVIANVAVSPVFQSPLVISMEVSASDTRAHIAMMQCLGWTLGICLMPMIAWLSGDWMFILLVTTIPCGAFLFLYKQFPESPRWLAGQRKPEKCLKVLKYICKVNGTTLPSDTMAALNRLAETKEKTYGFASLFTSWRLSKNTIIICISWVINSLSYYVLLLNITTMAGNPFMNFFWQALAELPGYIIARHLSDRWGRRWTQSGVMFLILIFCVALTFVVTDPSLAILGTVLVVFVKFFVTMTFYVVYLQALEIYPTSVRQTGTSCGTVVANALGIVGPYIVYLGTTYDSRYPYYILGGMGLVGGIATSFLPETLNQKLPENLSDAHSFGEDQSYWSFSNSVKTNKGYNLPTEMKDTKDWAS